MSVEEFLRLAGEAEQKTKPRQILSQSDFGHSVAEEWREPEKSARAAGGWIPATIQGVAANHRDGRNGGTFQASTA